MDRRSFFQHSILTSLSAALGLRAHASEQDLAKVLEDKEIPLIPSPPSETENQLERWRRQDRLPIWDSDHPSLLILIQAVRANRRVRFTYGGGSTPGSRRVISPSLVFAVKNFPGTYVSGYCHEREEERSFLFTRIADIRPLGQSPSPPHTGPQPDISYLSLIDDDHPDLGLPNF